MLFFFIASWDDRTITACLTLFPQNGSHRIKNVIKRNKFTNTIKKNTQRKTANKQNTQAILMTNLYVKMYTSQKIKENICVLVLNCNYLK